jgi:hypothetical protein
MHKLLAIAVLVAFSFNANAVVVNTLGGVDFEWLELTETAGMSRDQVEAELLDVNSDLYGYKYASKARVESLFLSYTSFDGQNGYHGDAGVLAGAQSLLDDFGALSSSAGTGTNSPITTTVDGYSRQTDGGFSEFLAIYGLKSECGTTEQSCQGGVKLLYDAADSLTMVYQSKAMGWDQTWELGGKISDDYGRAQAGHFLVNVTAVPVPAAVWLFGSALAGLGWFRRKTA